MPTNYINTPLVSPLTDLSGYVSVHAELERIGDEWLPTGRMHVYLYRQTEGVCTFFLEQDAEENWEANDEEIPQEIVDEIGQRIQNYIEESK